MVQPRLHNPPRRVIIAWWEALWMPGQAFIPLRVVREAIGQCPLHVDETGLPRHWGFTYTIRKIRVRIGFRKPLQDEAR